MRLLGIIPAYQLADHIGRVVTELKSLVTETLVIDDGSTDETAEIAFRSGAKVISHGVNLGKGAALKTGFNYAVTNEYDVVITLDGDGQHDPTIIPSFLTRLEQTGAEMIIGSRVRDKADMPWPRKCSNFLTSHIISRLLKARIEDSQSGYRLIKVSMLKGLILNSERYELETEIIIKAIKSRYKIDFVPIKVIYGGNFPSSIRGWADTYRWIKMVLEEI